MRVDGARGQSLEAMGLHGGVVVMDERLIGAKLARMMLGAATYGVIQGMIREGYVQGEWIGHRRRLRFVATVDSWWDGYNRWRKARGLPPVERRRHEGEISARQAASMLGIGASTLQRMIKLGYVTPRYGPKNSLLASPKEWRDGFERFRRDFWGETVEVKVDSDREHQQEDNDPLLSMTQARKLLGCGEKVASRLVHGGYVRTMLDRRHRRFLAPASEWIRGYQEYLRDAGNSTQAVMSVEARRLTLAREMTESVLTGIAIVYGEKQPRCWVCGRRLRMGDPWRWFVPAALQPKPWAPEPVFGCAKGHEGMVVEVRGRAYRITPAGQAPEKVRATEMEVEYDRAAGQ